MILIFFCSIINYYTLQLLKTICIYGLPYSAVKGTGGGSGSPRCKISRGSYLWSMYEVLSVPCLKEDPRLPPDGLQILAVWVSLHSSSTLWSIPGARKPSIKQALKSCAMYSGTPCHLEGALLVTNRLHGLNMFQGRDYTKPSTQEAQAMRATQRVCLSHHFRPLPCSVSHQNSRHITSDKLIFNYVQ